MNASDMDDMLFECNKNAIYVLNTNYAYGEFGRLNLFGGSTVNNVAPNEPASRGQRSSQTCRGGDSLYRSSSTTLVSSNLTTEVPHISVTERSTLSSTTSSSSRTIPKLFHYSPNQQSDHLLQNHNLNSLPYESQDHHRQQQQLQQSKTKHSSLPKSSGLTSSTTSLGVAMKSTSSSTTPTTSKKSSNLKSTIIAKKTKFWKYLEEEKWKKSTSVGNLTTTNCERNSDGSLMKNNGGMINNNNGGANNSNTVTNNGGRSKNSTDDCGSNINGSNSQKSSTELYKEAAELLGLSCTLCDNCRCLDCQSRYFECDDSDSYSELSFLGDYFDTYEDRHHQQNVRHCQQLNGSTSNADCCSLQSDNSSICSANSNNSDSPRDLSLDDSVSITN